jgi:plastocyanin
MRSGPRSGPRLLDRALAGAALLACFAAPARAETIRVEISKLVFAPAQITAHLGDTIEWINADIIAHTATSKSKEFDVMIAPKATALQVLTQAGAFDFYCRFHPNMTGHMDVATK